MVQLVITVFIMLKNQHHTGTECLLLIWASPQVGVELFSRGEYTCICCIEMDPRNSMQHADLCIRIHVAFSRHPSGLRI
jgi:hypothetical protein